MDTGEALQRTMNAHLQVKKGEGLQQEITEIIAALLLASKRNGLAIRQIADEAVLMAANSGRE